MSFLHLPPILCRATNVFWWNRMGTAGIYTFYGAGEERTPYGDARSKAYHSIDPLLRAELPLLISEKLRSLRIEQSLAEWAEWNRAHQQIPTTQNQPVEGVTYAFGRNVATSQQEHNAQWGPEPVDIPRWITTHADVQNFLNPAKGSLQKRQGVLDNLDASVSKGNSTAARTAEFQLYLNAYRTVQANISDLLFPFFDAVLNGTNNSLIYDIVWSVYSDLTGLGPQIIGPFSYGMHCFDWMEEAYLNSTRNTANNISSHTSSITSTNSSNVRDPMYQQMLATHYTLIEFYGYVWTNASAIANQTGLLRDLVILSEYLTPVHPSIMSADWTSLQSQFDDSYFTAYNTTQ